MSLIEKVIGDFGDKRRWKEHRARVGALTLPYRTAAQALERYLLYFGATDGDRGPDGPREPHDQARRLMKGQTTEEGLPPVLLGRGGRAQGLGGSCRKLRLTSTGNAVSAFSASIQSAMVSMSF